MAVDDATEKAARIAHERGAYDRATQQLMTGYGDEVFRFCLSMLDDREDAQDILQVTFIQVLGSLARFQGNSSFRTWLFSIARHRCLDQLKKTRRLKDRVTFTDEPPECADERVLQASDSNLNRVLEICLRKLTAKVRETVLLKHLSDMSYPEIADIVQEKEGTLQARVARALPSLRKCVEEQGVTL